jgi:hypothetical protein
LLVGRVKFACKSLFAQHQTLIVALINSILSWQYSLIDQLQIKQLNSFIPYQTLSSAKVSDYLRQTHYELTQLVHLCQPCLSHRARASLGALSLLTSVTLLASCSRARKHSAHIHGTFSLGLNLTVGNTQRVHLLFLFAYDRWQLLDENNTQLLSF